MAGYPSPTTMQKGVENVETTYSPGSSDPSGAKTYQAYASKVGVTKANEVAAKSGAQTRAIVAKEKASPGSVTRHKGGPIPKDGTYLLKAGEHVLTAGEADKARKHALMASGMKSLAKPGKKK